MDDASVQWDLPQAKSSPYLRPSHVSFTVLRPPFLRVQGFFRTLSASAKRQRAADKLEEAQVMDDLRRWSIMDDASSGNSRKRRPPRLCRVRRAVSSGKTLDAKEAQEYKYHITFKLNLPKASAHRKRTMNLHPACPSFVSSFMLHLDCYTTLVQSEPSISSSKHSHPPPLSSCCRAPDRRPSVRHRPFAQQTH